MHVALVLELALDREQVVLGVVDEHDPPRADARDLAAQLGADRAAGAGDEHDLARRGSARRGRAPCAPARGRARPRPAPRAPGARVDRAAAAARRPSAACAPGCRARGTRARIRAQRRPGAEGIAMITSSGSASSRMRGRSPRWCRARARRRSAAAACAGRRRRSRPACRPSSRLRAISRSTRRPPSPAPTISTLRSPLRPRGTPPAGGAR